MTKIVIPASGRGTRFSKVGYENPKPFIRLHGKYMLEYAVSSINVDGQYIILLLKEHLDRFDIKPFLDNLKKYRHIQSVEIVPVEKVTEGAACTILLAENYINDEQLIIANSDQYTPFPADWNNAYKGNHDGCIVTFTSSEWKWSYCKLDDHEILPKIIEVAEKHPISNIANVGVYKWTNGFHYVDYAKQMINKNIRVNGEFYVSLVYNEAIKDGKFFTNYDLPNFLGLGTPEDVIANVDKLPH